MSEKISLDAIKLLVPETARPFAKVKRHADRQRFGFDVKRIDGILQVSIGHLAPDGLIKLQEVLSKAAAKKLSSPPPTTPKKCCIFSVQ
jgi:hypothetical protein